MKKAQNYSNELKGWVRLALMSDSKTEKNWGNKTNTWIFTDIQNKNLRGMSEVGRVFVSPVLSTQISKCDKFHYSMTRKHIQRSCKLLRLFTAYKYFFSLKFFSVKCPPNLIDVIYYTTYCQLLSKSSGSNMYVK